MPKKSASLKQLPVSPRFTEIFKEREEPQNNDKELRLPTDKTICETEEEEERHFSEHFKQPERLVEEGRTFFCSELVAKCWKVCGIMKPTE